MNPSVLAMAHTSSTPSRMLGVRIIRMAAAAAAHEKAAWRIGLESVCCVRFVMCPAPFVCPAAKICVGDNLAPFAALVNMILYIFFKI